MASTAGTTCSCPSGEYCDPGMGCQFCSKITNTYQEIICPCEASLDAVVGCKEELEGGTLCINRSIAIKKCISRGYTIRAPHTAASADSTTATRPTTTFTANGTLSTFVIFETRSWVLASTRTAEQLSSPLPVGNQYLSGGLVLALIAALLLCIVFSVLLYHCLKNRRQMQRLHANQEALPLAPLADPAVNSLNPADEDGVAPNSSGSNDSHEVSVDIQLPQDAEAFGSATAEK